MDMRISSPVAIVCKINILPRYEDRYSIENFFLDFGVIQSFIPQASQEGFLSFLRPLTEALETDPKKQFFVKGHDMEKLVG